MKSPRTISILLVLLFLLTSLIFQAPSASAAAAWQTVGSANFSAGMTHYTSLALDASGTPYVAYRDVANSEKATVMKFNGSSWVTVGSAGFSAGIADYDSLAIYNGTPYVAYKDWGNSGKATVMKFNGSSWVNVGTAGFSAGTADYTSLAIYNGTPYVAYKDVGNSSKATVMKFNGSSWVTVGSAGFSAGTANYTSLAIDTSGTPYIAYEDYGNNYRATVMKFNGSSWVNVGSAGFSAGCVSYTSLALDTSGTPYVAFEDCTNAFRATVMKYNGSSWVTVGSAGFSALDATFITLELDASNMPYVAYRDDGNSMKATVMKYNGSSWEIVGSAGFSAGGAYYPSLTIDASGTPYIAYADSGNSYKANVMRYGSPAPANDDFDTPETITSVPYTNTQDTTTATTAVDDPNFQCSSYNTGTNSVWYTFTPSQNGTLTASTQTSNFDTVMALWTGTRGSLNSVACNDDYGGFMYSRVVVSVQAGVQYFIEVAGYKYPASPTPGKEWKAGDRIPSPDPLGASSGTLYLSVNFVADPVIQTLTVQSVGAYDGWILESSETSNKGGTLDATSATFFLGDDAQDKQYRAILHFDTSTLPDTAVITKVTLKIKKQGVSGTNPFTILGGLKVDMRKPYFGANAGLVVGDFQAAAGKSSVATFSATPVSNWYSAVIGSAGYPYINLTGTTQFRLRFATDDNNDNGADYMKFYSGNYATAAAQPTLIIEYYIP